MNGNQHFHTIILLLFNKNLERRNKWWFDARAKVGLDFMHLDTPENSSNESLTMEQFFQNHQSWLWIGVDGIDQKWFVYLKTWPKFIFIENISYSFLKMNKWMNDLIKLSHEWWATLLNETFNSKDTIQRVAVASVEVVPSIYDIFTILVFIQRL